MIYNCIPEQEFLCGPDYNKAEGFHALFACCKEKLKQIFETLKEQ